MPKIHEDDTYNEEEMARMIVCELAPEQGHLTISGNYYKLTWKTRAPSGLVYEHVSLFPQDKYIVKTTRREGGGWELRLVLTTPPTHVAPGS